VDDSPLNADVGRLNDPLPGLAPLIDRSQPRADGATAPVALVSRRPTGCSHARIAQFTPAT
jgi:hypothetical protein